MHCLNDFTQKAVVKLYHPIVGHNLLRIAKLNEEPGVRVVAKLEA